MTGSLHDAEDLVQETYLRAWKAYGGFKGQSSLRTWLYRIATNTCLTALDSGSAVRCRRGWVRRVRIQSMTSRRVMRCRGLSPSPINMTTRPTRRRSSVLGSRCGWRSSQRCSICRRGSERCWCCVRCCNGRRPRWPPRSATSTAAVNSLLQRARAQLDAVGPSEDDQLRPPESPEAQDLLTRYIAAFESYDIDKLAELFTAEAVWEMPPFDGWYQGPENIVLLSKTHCPAERAGDMRFIRTTANGQPAAALYMINRETGVHEPFQMHVMAVSPGGISHVVAFHMLSFDKFGLPATL